MAKEGDWGTVRLPSGEMRKVHLDCRATIGQVGNTEHINVEIGKAGRSAGWAAPAQPRRHHEPRRSPDGRWRRPQLRRPSPVLAVGHADQGLQDPQQQAHDKFIVRRGKEGD
jgi:large subunit ribosomal protein L2